VKQPPLLPLALPPLPHVLAALIFTNRSCFIDIIGSKPSFVNSSVCPRVSLKLIPREPLDGTVESIGETIITTWVLLGCARVSDREGDNFFTYAHSSLSLACHSGGRLTTHRERLPFTLSLARVSRLDHGRVYKHELHHLLHQKIYITRA
jgi:hypothetical protein